MSFLVNIYYLFIRTDEHLSSGSTIVSAISNEGCLQIYMSTFASLRLNVEVWRLRVGREGRGRLSKPQV